MTTRTACTYDCPDACGLLVDQEPGGVSIRGDPDHPITRGFVCQRIRRHPARLASAERVTSPLVRRGAGWEPIDWPAALDLAAKALREALEAGGAASVVPILGGGSLGLSKELVRHFFRSLGPVTEVAGGLCGEAGEEAQRLDFGDCASHDYTDLAHSRAIVLWGKNPIATGPHLVPFLKEARNRGVPLVCVDALPSPSVKLADHFVRVAPSGDGFLALAVLRLLLDTGRLDEGCVARTEGFDDFERLLRGASWTDFCSKAGSLPSDVELLADLYSGHRPVATHVGWGLQRRRSGGRNLRCIDALGVLTGNVGVAGGGVSFTSWRRRGLDFSFLAPATGREVSSAHLGRDLAALRDPPAGFVYVCAANPVTSNPDSAAVASALRGAGFVVVADAFLTDTAEEANLFLPVALMLEEDDAVGSYAHHHVARARRAVEAPEGVRGDLWIVRELRRRLGFPADPVLEDPGAALARMTALWFDGVAGTRNPTQAKLPFADGFATPSGRMRLLTELPETVSEIEGYPLVFMTVSHQAWQTSQLPGADQAGPATCFLSPEAPGAGGLSDGDLARIVSPVGSLVARVRLDPRMRPDLCLLHRGGWVKFGRGVNLLVEARATDLGGGAAFYDQRVRIEPA